MVRIAMIAGEASGDNLGAGLINELKKTFPDLVTEGIGGRGMLETGMRSLFPMEKLSVMGFTEVISRYRELKKIRTELKEYFIENKPDLFIGIDAPDFNLWLERELRHAGIKTIHYVSPSVWAWRESRVKKIKESVDLILNLFPFEKEIYQRYKVPNCYVGHPLADQLPELPDKMKARESLGLPRDKTIISLLPGSRENEIKNISGPLLLAAKKIKESDNDIQFVSGLTNEKLLSLFDEKHNDLVPGLKIDKYVGKTHELMEASDFIILASGTVSLEAMLLQKPMVVAYRLSWPTYFIVKLLAKIPYASLPNIIAGQFLVPECLQSDCNPEKIATESLKLLESTEQLDELKNKFRDLSKQLRKDANKTAAEAVIKVLNNSYA